jgi:hypothetical protein
MIHAKPAPKRARQCGGKSFFPLPLSAPGEGILDVIFVMDFEISPTLHAAPLKSHTGALRTPEGHPLAPGPVSLKDL